jgi:hypothetical protein
MSVSSVLIPCAKYVIAVIVQHLSPKKALRNTADDLSFRDSLTPCCIFELLFLEVAVVSPKDLFLSEFFSVFAYKEIFSSR